MKKRADGRYKKSIVIGYTREGKPKRKYLYGKTQKELDDKVREAKNNLAAGIKLDQQDITVEEWSLKWLETYKKNCKYNTQKMYKGIITKHIIPEIGSIKLKNLKTYHIQEMLNKCYDNGLTRTIKLILLTISQILEKAVINDYILKNVALQCELPKIASKKRNALTQDEIDIVIKTSEKHKNGLFFLTLLYTGMRRGEIIALTWNDIDFNNNYIDINKAVEFRHNQAIVKTPKTSSSIRLIPIPQILHNNLLKAKSKSNSIYVFPKIDGQMMSEIAIKRLTESFIKECQTIKPNFTFTIHQLRHTYATILYNAGVGLKEAQTFLGHSNISVTMDIYTHLENKNQEKAKQQINEFIAINF